MKLIFSLLLPSLILCTQYVPLTKKKDGLIQGTSKVLVIEAFYDILCPDSRLSFQAFQTVIDTIGLSQFQYIIHQYPLQYHKNALTASAGFRYIMDNVSEEAAYKFAEIMLLNLESFTDKATLNLSLNQVIQQFAKLAQDNLGQHYVIDNDELIAAMKPLSEYDVKTRQSWKYGTSRNIAGTPQFLVNGVWLDGAQHYDANDWIQFINAKNPKQM